MSYDDELLLIFRVLRLLLSAADLPPGGERHDERFALLRELEQKTAELRRAIEKETPR
jgi:hypothetical protein